MSQARFCIAADDPCLDGHFPGAPIVPGVVLLERVTAALRAVEGHRVAAVERCKFLGLLHPGEPCTIAWEAPAGNRLRFRCDGPDGLLVQGRLRLAGCADG